MAGLISFLDREYDNLITIDLFCGNAPSQFFFHKYVEESFPNGVESYEFRNKHYGWNSTCVQITHKSGRIEIRNGGFQDDYQRIYHNHIMCPPHCEKCMFQQLPRYGDITIGDFWGIERKDIDIDVTRGCSAVLCNSHKGK